MREFTHQIAIALPIGEAFPLFTPRGEEQWVPGWAPRYLWPESGETCRDMVFVTGQGDEATLWTCLDWQPDRYRVRYHRATPASQLAFVEVACTPDGPNRTIAQVTYRYLPLTPVGERSVGSMSVVSFAGQIDRWSELIDRWLSHGRVAPSGQAAAAAHAG